MNKLLIIAVALIGCSKTEPQPVVERPSELESAVRQQELVDFADKQRKQIEKEIGDNQYRSSADILRRYPKLVVIQNGSGGNAQEFLASCERRIKARDELYETRMEMQRKARQIDEITRSLEVPTPLQ